MQLTAAESAGVLAADAGVLAADAGVFAADVGVFAADDRATVLLQFDHRFLTFHGKIGILGTSWSRTRVFWHSPVLVELKIP